MPTKKTPLQRQKDEHGSKEKLVDRLIPVLNQVRKIDVDTDDLKLRLLAASNDKLLRMLAVAGEIQQKFGTFDKLIDAVATVTKHAKDAPYRERLKKMSPAQLLDMHRSLAKQDHAA